MVMVSIMIMTVAIPGAMPPFWASVCHAPVEKSLYKSYGFLQLCRDLGLRLTMVIFSIMLMIVAIPGAMPPFWASACHVPVEKLGY